MKKPWLSKTLWVSVIVAIAPLIPGVSPIIIANTEYIGLAVGAVFGLLRLVSKDQIKMEA
jgi:hypothetical protein